jgi:hypothetical protein
MDACAARRLLLFSLPTPKLPPEHPLLMRRRRGRGRPGIARCAAEAGAGWGGIVEDDLSELLQVRIRHPFWICLFSPTNCTDLVMPCGASRKRFGSTENFVQNGREVWALYEFLFVVDVKSLPLELQLQVYQSCKFSSSPCNARRVFKPCMNYPEYKYL